MSLELFKELFNDAEEDVIFFQRFKKKMAKCVLSEIEGAEFYAAEMEEDKYSFKMNLFVSVLDEIAQMPSHQVDNGDDENQEDDNEMEDNEVKDNEVDDEDVDIAQIPSLQVDNVDDENDEDSDNEMDDENDDDDNEMDIVEIVRNALLHRKIVKEGTVGDNDQSLLSREIAKIPSHQPKNKVNVEKMIPINNHKDDILDIVKKHLLLRNISQIPSHQPQNKVNGDKMIGINKDHDDIVDIDNNQDIMFLYQDLDLGQKCPRLSSSKSNPHLHFKFTKPNSYSPEVYRRIVKKYFLKKFNKYYPSENSTQSEMYNFVQCFVFDIRLAMHCIFTQKQELFIQLFDLLSALDKISQLFLLGNKSNWKKWKIENEFYNFYNFSMFKKELLLKINSL